MAEWTFAPGEMAEVNVKGREGDIDHERIDLGSLHLEVGF